jgi:hypothetical protein
MLLLSFCGLPLLLDFATALRAVAKYLDKVKKDPSWL